LRFVAVGLALLALSLPALTALAAPVTVEGITFSDERGDFTIVKVTGTGTPADPFTIVEDVTGGAPILVIRGFDERFGNRIGSQHVMGMAITKIVINHTGAPWTEYRLELRSAPAISPTSRKRTSPMMPSISTRGGWRSTRR
jgi:hypothetical protein